MKYVHETLGIETYTVVYWTLFDDKKPPLDSYDNDFNKYTELLADKHSGVLKEVYAVNEKKSLAKDFLPECIALVEKYIHREDACSKEYIQPFCLAKVYINQYKVLLEHLGGKEYMKSTEKKLVEEIYGNKEKFEAVVDFLDFWNNRENAIAEVLKDKFHEKFPQKAPKTIHGCEDVFETGKDDVLVFYWYDGKEENAQIGFTSLEGKKFSKKQQNELLEVIAKIPNKYDEQKEDEWVYCKIKESATFIDDVMKALEILFSV